MKIDLQGMDLQMFQDKHKVSVRQFKKKKGSRRDGVFDTWTRSKCVIVECGLHFGNVFENCGIVLRHSFMIYSLFLDF